ncbi:MAG: late competence development ComFB family protein [Defluviitaleaceae bacterium]|nr:late competence development ComFB family protein [Defluviitaleaceae bacterium]MCL2836577.1 late competence development ComFB family protein [Defluviitaleaceae bacterium]
MHVRNYMETIVFDMIDTVLKNFDCCTCEKCRNDIAAYALNNLPPKYIVSNEVYSKLSTLHQQFGVDVMSKLAVGVKLIKDNPRH